MTVEGAARSDSEPNLEPASKTLSVVAQRPFDKRAVLVLGMHRSGTSAVTRLLNLLGADLPSKLMPPLPDNNPLGFWESQKIAEIHDELLASAGSSWDDVAAFPRTWFDSDVAKSFQDQVVQILRANFAASRLFVIKDPRICRLVPFWRTVLNEFGAEPHYVISVRNPLEVAASLKARDGFLPAKSLLLWLRYLLEAERETPGQKRSFVRYPQVLRNWGQTAATISANLEISWPRTSDEAGVEIEMFLSESARHHSFSAEELDSRSEVVDWVKRAYAATLATDERAAPMLEVLDDVRSRLDAADQAFGPLLAEARLSLGRESERAQLIHGKLTEREEELTAQAIEMQRLFAALTTRDTEVEAQARKIEEQTSNLGSVNQVVADKQAQIERLSGDLVSRDAEIQQLREKASSSSQQIERLNHEAAARNRDVEVRDREIKGLRGDATLARQQVAELRQEVASLLGSESWRVSRPLRGLANRLMRRKRLWALLMWCYTRSLNAES